MPSSFGLRGNVVGTPDLSVSNGANRTPVVSVPVVLVLVVLRWYERLWCGLPVVPVWFGYSLCALPVVLSLIACGRWLSSALVVQRVVLCGVWYS